MNLDETALRPTVLIGETDQFHRRPLYSEIVHRAHKAGLAGARAFRGIEGFGKSSRIHTTRLLSLSEDLPVSIVIVDTVEKVRAFLPRLGSGAFPTPTRSTPWRRCARSCRSSTNHRRAGAARRGRGHQVCRPGQPRGRRGDVVVTC